MPARQAARNRRKRRGFCPSCGARRLAQTAAHLVDHVIPRVPVRQWVLSLPIPLRVLLAGLVLGLVCAQTSSQLLLPHRLGQTAH